MACSACEGRRNTIKNLSSNEHWQGLWDAFDGYEFAWDTAANIVGAILIAVLVAWKLKK